MDKKNRDSKKNSNLSAKAQPRAVLKLKTGLTAGKPLGDAVANVTHATGLDRLANGYTKVTGTDCGCDKRRRWLNHLFPGSG